MRPRPLPPRARLARDRAWSKPALSRDIQNHLAQHLRALLAPDDEGAFPTGLRKLLRRLEEVLAAQERPLEPWFHEGLLAALPSLRAFAISLVGDAVRADDMVQDAVLRALRNRDRFEAGTCLQAWLFTILRNAYYTEQRRRRREVEDADGAFADLLRAPPEQLDKVHVQEVRLALQRLGPEQREALLLVGAEGVSYEEAALICGCKVGTIKSRVNRARARLAELLGDTGGDLGADMVMQAALNDQG
jgi:RNA polymerase sigma-70 factor (ECF subfamily)